MASGQEVVRKNKSGGAACAFLPASRRDQKTRASKENFEIKVTHQL